MTDQLLYSKIFLLQSEPLKQELLFFIDYLLTRQFADKQNFLLLIYLVETPYSLTSGKANNLLAPITLCQIFFILLPFWRTRFF